MALNDDPLRGNAAAALGRIPSANQNAPGFMPGVRAVYNESGKAIGDLASQGRYGAAAGEIARAALSYVPALTDDVVGGAVRAVGPGVMDAGRQLLGINSPSPADSKPSAAAPASVAANPADQRLAAGAQATPAAVSAADAMAGPTMPASGNITRVGNSYSGGNVSGDIAINGAAPGGGTVSSQNMQAADALAGRQTPATAVASPAPAQGAAAAMMAAPVVRNSTNDWAARKALENAQTSASSITNHPEWSGGASTDWRGRVVGGQADPNGSVAAYQAALKNDLALQGAQPGVDVAAMNANAGLQREGMQQQGANQRANQQAGLEQQRINQAGVTQGFKNRAALRLEGLQAAYQGAKTDAERASLARQIREIQGVEKPDQWAHSPGGQVIDPKTQQLITQPGVIYNKGTGQTLGAQQPGQGGGAGEAGLARAMAIRDDKTMTREQKVVALERLGVF